MKKAALIFLLLSFMSCKKNTAKDPKEFIFDFQKGTYGWNVLFSDYPVGEDSFFELTFEYSWLPPPLDNSCRSFKISGNNHSDDLLSVIYRKIDGLLPNTKYAVSFNIELASKVSTNSVGAGGSPNISIGGGGVSEMPQNRIALTGSVNYYRPNFISSLQSNTSNESLKVLGRIGVSDTTTQFTLVNRNNLSEPISLTTNSKGELWVMIGTDSGFEGITTLYYKKISVFLK